MKYRWVMMLCYGYSVMLVYLTYCLGHVNPPLILYKQCVILFSGNTFEIWSTQY